MIRQISLSEAKKDVDYQDELHSAGVLGVSPRGPPKSWFLLSESLRGECTPIMVVGIHDAQLLSGKSLRSQRGYLGLLCHPEVLILMEWESSTIRKGDAINSCPRGSQLQYGI